MSEYAGFCTEALTGPTAWGPGDVMGYLIEHEPEGWYAVAEHYSSSEVFSANDITRHFKEREKPGDTFTWFGTLTSDQAFAQFPPGPELERHKRNAEVPIKDDK